MERSKRFYEETLGLNSDRDGGFPEFQLGDNVSLYLVDPRRSATSSRPHTARSRCASPDVREARSELEAKGVEFHGDILDTGVCHMAFFADPDGNALMLHRRYAPRVES